MLSKHINQKIDINDLNKVDDYSIDKIADVLSIPKGHIMQTEEIPSYVFNTKDQIEKSRKITITDPNATRYLMSISEACELIIKISIFGDNSGIYLLDMGKPINIYDMTYKLIKFNGKYY